MTAVKHLLPALPWMFARSDRICARIFLNLAHHYLPEGTLSVSLPDGGIETLRGSRPGPEASLTLHSFKALRRLLMGGVIGLSESYMDGDWDSADLATVLELGGRNGPNLQDIARGGMVRRFLGRLHHRANDNSKAGSRRNIAAHYDLGNDFYAQWLDPSMTYSAGLFDGPADSLASAQTRKYRRIAEDLALEPGQRILEIGCGWGGFAEMAARDYGVQVVGLTLSEQQRIWAQDRMEKAGLADKVDIRLQDYRDVTGRFDRVVSIEMIEAVGERWWPTYFAALHDRLRPGGSALLQAITIDDQWFPAYRQGCDFIQRHVFPGGMLPSPGALAHQAREAALTLTTKRCFGADYERTLAHWNTRFQEAWPAIARLGYEVRFKRLWEFYLAYCRAGFRNGIIDVRHLLLTRGATS